MIRMTRVRLINWHNFVDDTIDFKTISYFIGVNAVGKTTIMDAIRYCITTNKEFNTAGNKKSGRTLQGSVHQKQRADNDYLRPGHTVSYIGIEFLDEAIQKRFTIVARVESESPYQELKSVSQDWYISKPGYTLDDMPFFVRDKQGRRPSKRDEFKLDNRGMERASSQVDARRRICRQLGIGDAESNTGKKFNKVFHMGTSLEDITDIRKFIYTYILPEPEVNIEGLYQDMRELENLQEVLEESRRRADVLEKINEQLETAMTYESRVKVFEILLCYAKWQAQLTQRKNLSESMQSFELEYSVLSGQIQELEAKREQAHNRLLEAQSRLKDDENHQKMESLRLDFKDKQKAYEELKGQAARFDAAVEDFEKLVGCLMDFEIAQDTDLSLPDTGALDYARQIGTLKNRLGDFSKILREKLGELLVAVSRASDEIKRLSNELKSLEAGKMSYPEEAELVRNAINRAFEERGIKEQAKLLCELLEMSNPVWQDAVESYLNMQRLYIVVPPARYLLAKQIFVSLGDAVRGIGLIDTVSLMKQNYAGRDEFTLAKTVETGNPYARAYIDYRLGDVVCCESLEDLEKYAKSVTADRLRYQGYVLQRMRKQKLYIGQDAVKKRLAEASKELTEVQSSKKALEAKQEALSNLDSKYQTFMAGDAFIVLSSYCRARKNAERQYAETQALDARIKELERNPIMQGMVNREAECRSEYAAVNNALTDKTASRKTIENRLVAVQDQLKKLVDIIAACEAEYTKYQSTHARYIPDMEEEYVELTRRQTPAEIISNNQTQGTLQRRMNERDNYIRDNLIPLQRQYNAEYNMDFLPGLEGMEQYQSAYLSLTRIDIERHQSNVQQAQARCKERFRKEVLFRMKDDIERARRLFRDLNRVMGGLKYGEESYEFFISGSKDKELQIFYNLIMDKDNRQIREELELFSLMEDTASDVFESQIEEFMQRIMVEVEQRSQQSVSGQKLTGMDVSAYADYRTYLDYDILVKNSVTGKEAKLSQVSGDGSGGENQAPFYVAICASLLQIYQQSENCIQLVLLDEAFNNMTSDRIKPMMEMFRNLNLQLVLIATPEKCTTIYPYCDATYSIIKQGSRNAVALFENVEK